MAEALLEVRNLSRRFAAVDALKQVNFCVEAGEVHALIGPNGAGKTTFIHHVSGALKPDSGSVHFAGKDVTALSMHQRVAAGMARSYQITNIFTGLSVLDNVALAVRIARHTQHGWDNAALPDDFHDIAELLNVSERVARGFVYKIDQGRLQGDPV